MARRLVDNHIQRRLYFCFPVPGTLGNLKAIEAMIMGLLKGPIVTTILLLSRQNCGEIMTQNLHSKHDTLLQPQEKDIKRFSKGGQTSVFFFSGDTSHSQ